jgi:hypothetical protein
LKLEQPLYKTYFGFYNLIKAWSIRLLCLIFGIVVYFKIPLNPIALVIIYSILIIWSVLITTQEIIISKEKLIFRRRYFFDIYTKDKTYTLDEVDNLILEGELDLGKDLVEDVLFQGSSSNIIKIKLKSGKEEFFSTKLYKSEILKVIKSFESIS